MSESELQERAKELGVSAEDLYEMDLESETKAEEDVTSDLKFKIPKLKKRKQKAALKKAVRGVSSKDEIIADNNDPFAEFLNDLSDVLANNLTRPATLQIAPEPFTSTPIPIDAKLTIGVVGGKAWRFDDRARLYGVPAESAQNPYNIAVGSTLTTYLFQDVKRSPQRAAFFAKNVASDALFGKKKRRTAPLSALPFKLSGTGISENDASRKLVLPEDVKVSGAKHGVIFPLSGGYREGQAIGPGVIKASGGAIVLVFDKTALRVVAILKLATGFTKRTFGGVPSSESLTTESGQYMNPATETRNAARIDAYTERAKEDDRVFGRIFDDAGDELVVKLQNNAVPVLGHALSRLRARPELANVSTRGRFEERTVQLSMLSETIRAGLAHMIKNTPEYQLGVTPQKASVMALVCWELALTFRWMIFGLVRRNVYVEQQRRWKTRRGMQTFSIDAVGKFPSDYFVLSFDALTQNETNSARVLELIDVLREYHVALLTVTTKYGDSVAEKSSGPSVAAILLRNYVMGHLSTTLAESHYTWPEQLENLVFVMLASGAALAKHAGMSDAQIRTSISTVTTSRFDPKQLVVLNNVVVKAARDLNDKRRPTIRRGGDVTQAGAQST